MNADASALLSHVEVCSDCRRLVGMLARARAEGALRGRALCTLESGHRLGERYQILQMLARGGMGEVYEARDQLLDEVVALKTIGLSALDDQRALAALKSEVLLARKVSHRNVCRILEFGIDRQDLDGKGNGDSVPFFTMELLRGETLRQRLHRVGTFSVAEALPIVLQMIDGLAAIHAAGIVHRDLKPENVFLIGEPQGLRAVVMDLGLARPLDLAQPLVSRSGTDSGGGSGDRPAGTLEYMAPEQLRGQPPTAGFDVYALGTILFELLAGTRPFARGRTGSWAAILERLDRPAPPLRDVVPGADPRWAQVIERCLAVEPGQRYRDITEVARVLSGPIPGPRSAPRPRRLAVWGGVTAAALVAAAALIAAGRPDAPGTPGTPAGTSLAPPASAPVELRPVAGVLPPSQPPSPGPPAVPARNADRVVPTDRPRRVASRPSTPGPPTPARVQTAETPAPAPAPAPKDTAALLEQAEELLVAGEGATACALGEQAARQAPHTASVHRFLGTCYMRVQDPQSARRHYRRYLELAPEAPDRVFVRAMIEQKR